MTSSPASFVPIIDISADPAAVAADLDEICRTAGFFQITGHGVPDDVAGPAWTAATRFFDLPMADKLSVARPTPDYPYGYIPLAGESLPQSIAGAAPPDLKEVFNIGPPDPPGHRFADPDEAWVYSPNLWPGALPGLRVAWTAYYEVLRDLEHGLLPERQLVGADHVPADLPGTRRTAPLRAGAGRAAPDGQVPPVGQPLIIRRLGRDW